MAAYNPQVNNPFTLDTQSGASDPYTPPSDDTYGGGYAYSGLDQYSGSGSLGGQGLQDLYSTYQEYGYLMGDAMAGFEVGGEQFGLQTYDRTQEDIVRKKYREDFRDFRRQSQDLYASAEGDRAKLAGKIGRSGFAGSGKGSMKDFQSGISGQVRDARLGFEQTRIGALDAISGIREDYQEGATNTYMTFLAQQPEDEYLDNADAITGCYNNPGMAWDHTQPEGQECVEMGALPDDWGAGFEGYEAEWANNEYEGSWGEAEEGSYEPGENCGNLAMSSSMCSSGCVTTAGECVEGTGTATEDNMSVFCDDPAFAANAPWMCP